MKGIIWTTCNVHMHPHELCSRCATALDMNARQTEQAYPGSIVDEWNRSVLRGER